MEIGDKLICKKEYFDSTLYGFAKINYYWIDKFLWFYYNYKLRKTCILKKGKVYTITHIYDYYNHKGYSKIVQISNKFQFFTFNDFVETKSDEYLYNYFYTKKEIRKNKLERIGHEM